MSQNAHAPQSIHYRAKQAANYLGIGISTFWRWTREGKLPKGTRLTDRCTIWAKSDLDNFIASRKGA